MAGWFKATVRSVTGRPAPKTTQARFTDDLDATHQVWSLPKAPAACYVIGDIHGRLDLCEALEAKIVAHAATHAATHAAPHAAPDTENQDQAVSDQAKLIVWVGDFIDRGPQTAALFARLQQPAPMGFQRISLMGNHEAMFEAFLADPKRNAAWLDFGGLETLRSYGVMHDANMSARQQLHTIHAHMPNCDIDCLKSLPLALRFPGYFISHAGINEDKRLESQTAQDLLWSNPENLPPDRDFGAVIVHGHRIVKSAYTQPNRISLDTGAYASGRLSAVCLSPNRPPELISISQ